MLILRQKSFPLFENSTTRIAIARTVGIVHNVLNIFVFEDNLMYFVDLK